MAQQEINIGAAANDGTGDTLRGAGQKINDNFTELYGAVTGLLDFKGSQDCSANPNYPAASKGDYYLVSVAGKIGGAAGIDVQAGDSFFALADNAGGDQAAAGANWTVMQGNVVIDNDATLAGDSAAKVPTQHAVKAYVDDAISGVGGGGGALTNSQAFLTADQVLGTTYADLAGMSLALGAGTWLVTAEVEASPSGTNSMFVKLHNDTDGTDIVATARAAPSGHSFAVAITVIVTLAAAATLKIQARHDASTMTVLRLVDSIPSTYMNAVQIG